MFLREIVRKMLTRWKNNVFLLLSFFNETYCELAWYAEDCPLLQWVRLTIMKWIWIIWIIAIFRYWIFLTLTKIHSKMKKSNENFYCEKSREKQILFCTVEADINIDYFVYLKYKYCDQPYSHFWLQESKKTLFVNKETDMFSLKKSFSSKFLYQLCFFIYPVSFLF